MNHYLQGIPESQTLPTETCLVLPHFQPSYMSQIIWCGGLSTKSLTLSEMTGAKNGKSPEMQQRRAYVWWEYRMVNKETLPYTHTSLFLTVPFCLLFCFFVGFFCFVFFSFLFHGISEQQERSTVWEKVKKLSKKFNKSRGILYLCSFNCCGVCAPSVEFFLKALCCKQTVKSSAVHNTSLCLGHYDNRYL